MQQKKLDAVTLHEQTAKHPHNCGVSGSESVLPSAQGMPIVRSNARQSASILCPSSERIMIRETNAIDALYAIQLGDPASFFQKVECRPSMNYYYTNDTTSSPELINCSRNLLTRRITSHNLPSFPRPCIHVSPTANAGP